MNQQQFSGRLVFLVLGGLILLALAFSSVPEAQAGRPIPSPAVEITEALTNTPSFTPTATQAPSIGCGSANLGGTCQQINPTTIGGSYAWSGDTSNWYNNSGNYGRFSMAAVSQTITVYVTWWESTVGMNSYYGVNRVYDVYNARNSTQLEKIANDVLLPGNGSSSYSQSGPKYYTLTITSGNGLYLFNQAVRSGSVGSYEGHGTFTVYVSTSGFYDPSTPTPTPTATATQTSTPTSAPTSTPTLTSTTTPSNCLAGDYEIQGVTGNNGTLDFFGVGGDSHVWNPAVMYHGDYVNSIWIIKDADNIVELGWYERGEGSGGGDLKFFRTWTVSGIYHEESWGSPSENTDHTFLLYTLNGDEAWRYVVDGEQKTPTIIAPDLYYGYAGAMRERHDNCDSGWAHWWNLQQCSDPACSWTPWQSINERNINDPDWFLDFVSISNFFVNLRQYIQDSQQKKQSLRYGGRMKTKLGKLFSLFALSVVIFLAIILSYGNISSQHDPTEFFFPTPSQPIPLGPQITEPLPNGIRVSFAEAQSRIGRNEIPIPSGLNIRETWITNGNVDSERQSVAIEFDSGILLIIHHMTTHPNWDGIISSTPELMKVSINGNTGVGANPGATHYNGKDYPYPGSVSWWMDGLYLSLYSDTLTLEELLKIAETVH